MLKHVVQLEELKELRYHYSNAVVRYSRMWCPQDIERDSWVWGEQETLWSMNFPHEVGDEALTV